MDDLERTFREGLRDAAAKKPPLGEIDLDEVTTRPVDLPRRRPARWLAAVAALVLVAGIGVGTFALSGRGTGVPAIPAPASPVANPVATDAPSVATCKVTDVGSALHPNRVSVRVFDDGSHGGVAKESTLYLRSHNFTVLEYGTTTGPIARTTIRGTAADSPEVRLVQVFFPGSVAEGDGRADHSVDVLSSTYRTADGPADASVPVSGPICLPQIIGSGVQVSVEVRVRNDTNLDFRTARVVSLEDKSVDFGRLPAGAVSTYHVVERAYPNAWLRISFDDQIPTDLGGQGGEYKAPTDSDLLGPGRYTYVFNLDAEGRLGLRLEVDR
ncbi:MAG TPA: LytR C-terminal domain-containing protein [Propionicimonas sp.]|jgi:hypothetical protein|uniref:LytR C-terminal domain-containing protein n=1 Tax=Propionicimonas sp. TaxID=1955623 RepID=UPI002F42B82B